MHLNCSSNHSENLNCSSDSFNTVLKILADQSAYFCCSLNVKRHLNLFISSDFLISSSCSDSSHYSAFSDCSVSSCCSVSLSCSVSSSYSVSLNYSVNSDHTLDPSNWSADFHCNYVMKSALRINQLKLNEQLT